MKTNIHEILHLFLLHAPLEFALFGCIEPAKKAQLCRQHH